MVNAAVTSVDVRPTTMYRQKKKKNEATSPSIFKNYHGRMRTHSQL